MPAEVRRAGTVVNEAVEGRPAGRSATAVAAYHGYRQRNVAPAVHLGLPSPFLTFILTLDEPLHIAEHVDRRRPAEVLDTLAGGLHTSPAVITHDGAQSGIQLLVSPLAARGLFGLPAAELAGQDVDAATLLGRSSAEIQDRVRTASSWPQRFALLDDSLARIMAHRGDRTEPPAPVAQAWRLLIGSGGRMPISALADAVGYSDRHLTNRFRAELGLTPKTAGRVIRFDRARRALQREVVPGRSTIGAVAAGCGYHDQSHLDRDFVSFTGRPPSRWMAEEYGNLQAGGAPAAADW